MSMAISPLGVAAPRLTAGSPRPAAPSAAPASPVDSAILSTAPLSTPATGSAPVPRSRARGLAGIGGAVAHAVGNTVAGLKFIGFGLVYKAEKALTEQREIAYSPCDNMPTPQIDRPFVLVPGWTTEPEAFGPLCGLLTRGGANGGEVYFVKQGKFFTMDANGQLQAFSGTPAKGKVFEMVWTDTHQAPNRNLSEMRQNMDAICKATGYDKVDAEAYSMGGLDARLYLDQGGTQINRLMMLGSPNRGTRFGDLVIDVLDRKVNWAAKFGGISGDDRESMDWLRQEKNSPILQDLNSRWAQQRKAATILAVGTDIMPTANASFWTWGDGLVPSKSLSPGPGDTIVLHDAMQHGRLNDDETVQHIRALYFGWGLPLNATDYWPNDAEIVKQVPRPPAPTPPPTP
jgi:pimeloyl-ACP methyl ester carboxylesterase